MRHRDAMAPSHAVDSTDTPPIQIQIQIRNESLMLNSCDWRCRSAAQVPTRIGGLILGAGTAPAFTVRPYPPPPRTAAIRISWMFSVYLWVAVRN